eukprot:135942-Chlamydomonas_euryale.AAC.2
MQRLLKKCPSKNACIQPARGRSWKQQQIKRAACASAPIPNAHACDTSGARPSNHSLGLMRRRLTASLSMDAGIPQTECAALSYAATPQYDQTQFNKWDKAPSASFILVSQPQA